MASATSESSSIEANAAAAADARGFRPVWNVPPNGAIEVGPDMDTDSWPALSESARASARSSSSESLRSLSEGAAPTSASATQGSLVSSPSLRPADGPPNIFPIQNLSHPARQRPMRRGSGSSGIGSGSSIPVNGGVVPTLQQPVLVEIVQSTLEGQTFHEHSPRGSRTSGFAPQTHGVNRRGNSGGGSHHNQLHHRDVEWNHNRNAYMQHPQQHGGGGGGGGGGWVGGGGIRSYSRPLSAAVSAPFVGPHLQVRPFVGNALGFPDVHHMYYVPPQPPPESLGVMPFAPHTVPPMFFPVLDPQRAQLLKQIDYYFSSENLRKDLFLRQNMDDQGWVPLSLIATFNRVRQLTDSLQYILDTVKFSTVVEVQEGEEDEKKIRRRNDWIDWLWLPSSHLGSTSGRQYPTSDYDVVSTRLHDMSLAGSTSTHIGTRGPVFARSASGNLNNQFQVVGDPVRDESSQFTAFDDSDGLRSSRSLSRSDTL